MQVILSLLSWEKQGIYKMVLRQLLKLSTINPQNPNGFTQTVTTLPEKDFQDKPKTGKKDNRLI